MAAAMIESTAAMPARAFRGEMPLRRPESSAIVLRRYSERGDALTLTAFVGYPSSLRLTRCLLTSVN